MSIVPPPPVRSSLEALASGGDAVRWTAAQLDDGMLDEIAEADYGMDAEAHRAALLRVRDELEIPEPDAWVPREVLELVRWSRPEDPDWGPGGHGRRGHVMRAFCCATLLAIGAEDDEGYLCGENETVVQLVTSSLALGSDGAEHLAALLAARILGDDHDEDRPFYTAGVVVLAAHAPGIVPPTLDLAELCAWLRADEARTASEGCGPGRGRWAHRWLLRTTFHDLCHHEWERAARQVLCEPTLPDGEAADALRTIGALLTGALAPGPDGPPDAQS